MRDELDTYEQIDRYLNEQLSGGELSDFENRMKADPSLYETVKAQKFVNELILDQGLLSLKKKMQAIDPGSYNSGNKQLGIYAGIALLVSLITIGIFIKKDVPENLPKQQSAKPQQVPEKINVQSKKIINNRATQSSNKNIHHQERDSIFVTDAVSIKETDSVKSVIVIHPKVNNSPVISHSTIVVEEHKQKSEAVICNLENSLPQITTTESCSDSPTGKIMIGKNSLLSGVGPFEFSINNKTYYSTSVFTNLYAGTYNLFIKDARGCVWSDEKDIIISESDCKIHEYSFYPHKGEVWKFPLHDNENGKIEIYSRNGSLVYNTQIINGYPDNWNGTADGQPLPMGSYSFILKCGEKVTVGNVTLFK